MSLAANAEFLIPIRAAVVCGPSTGDHIDSGYLYLEKLNYNRPSVPSANPSRVVCPAHQCSLAEKAAPHGKANLFEASWDNGTQGHDLKNLPCYLGCNLLVFYGVSDTISSWEEADPQLEATYQSCGSFRMRDRCWLPASGPWCAFVRESDGCYDHRNQVREQLSLQDWLWAPSLLDRNQQDWYSSVAKTLILHPQLPGS